MTQRRKTKLLHTIRYTNTNRLMLPIPKSIYINSKHYPDISDKNNIVNRSSISVIFFVLTFHVVSTRTFPSQHGGIPKGDSIALSCRPTISYAVVCKALK